MALSGLGLQRNPEIPLGEKVWQMNRGMILVILVLGFVGGAMLYSAAGGSFDPWASRQALRFGGGMVVLFAAALIDVRIWFRYAYLLYFAVLALLLAVEVAGSMGMGAQRWIDLKVFQLQPSEIMKVALVLALARYFHGVAEEDIGRPVMLLIPTVLVLAPAGLVLKQPDLGTAGMLLMCGAAVFFVAGVRLWKFALGLAAGLSAIPVAWQFLHDYQRQRVLTFLNPESDPLGAGYHILQSKIALGSGGLVGRGFLEGTQSHLNFLPEKQTDFIFTMLAEELGMVGAVALLALYGLLFVYGFAIALRARNQFGRILAIGLTTNLFLYVFLNMAMVMGLVPVVGVPLPLISYGGTAMLAVMGAFGLVQSVYVHRDIRIPRQGLRED